MSGNLDEAAADGQKEIDIFFRKSSPLIIKNDVGLFRAEHGIQLLVISVFHRNGNIGIFLRKQRQRTVKFISRKAAQIPDFKGGLIALGNFCGRAAHFLVIRSQNQTFLIEIFSRRRQSKSAVFTFQKLKAQFPLQRLNLLGNGRLRNEIFFRRLGKAVFPDDRLKYFSCLSILFTSLR